MTKHNTCTIPNTIPNTIPYTIPKMFLKGRKMLLTKPMYFTLFIVLPSVKMTTHSVSNNIIVFNMIGGCTNLGETTEYSQTYIE